MAENRVMTVSPQVGLRRIPLALAGGWHLGLLEVSVDFAIPLKSPQSAAETR